MMNIGATATALKRVFLSINRAYPDDPGNDLR